MVNEAINHSGLRRGGAGGAIALALGHRVTVRVSNFRGARSDPVVVTLAGALTGASDEGTRAAAFSTRAGTTIVDGQRAVTVTAGEKVVIVDVVIGISALIG